MRYQVLEPSDASVLAPRVTELETLRVSDLAETATLTDLSETGRKIKVVACVIRNEGTGWAFIENTTHGKLNCLAISETTSAITITFPFTAKKILSFVATADDDYIKQGLLVGASVGATSAVMKLSSSGAIGGYVYFNGTDWILPTGFTAVFSAGTLTLTHTEVGTGNLGSVDGRDGARATFGSIGTTTTQIKFYDIAGALITVADTAMKCFVTRLMGGASLNPANFITATGNIWCMGVFEVD